MQSYTEQTGRPPDFRVSYQLYRPEEGGRQTPLLQHVRWDFRYADKSISTSTFMIWPEFLLPSGALLTEGYVPLHGLADMFILPATSRAFHQLHIRRGLRGYFAEGSRQMGMCEVVEILGLHTNPVAQH
ncbi:hypothetical protein [Hymenobacter lucidus]|uniref:Uncharacterized protein n=1 Tax=Hymenobacter lucidus TaxID=2880930 RepID=A0ABS8ANC9_9BACT|nr:hypothetical protein [Hymenobacter lucidus]MCB2407609.1 hypothetical protein [Hymenobacter lucidus]